MVRTHNPVQVIENFRVFKDVFQLEAVVAHGFDYSYEHLQRFAHKMNRKYAKHDITVLVMHPDTEGEPLGIAYTYKHEPLVIVQRTSTLERARKSLENTDYYTHYKE